MNIQNNLTAKSKIKIMANTPHSTDPNGSVPGSHSRYLCDAPDAHAWPENVCTVLDFIQHHRDEGDSDKAFSDWETEFSTQITLPLVPAEYKFLVELLQLTDADADDDFESESEPEDLDAPPATSRDLLRQDLASLGRHVHQRMSPVLYNPRLCTITMTRQPESVFHLSFKQFFGQLIVERVQQTLSD